MLRPFSDLKPRMDRLSNVKGAPTTLFRIFSEIDLVHCGCHFVLRVLYVLQKCIMQLEY